MAELKAIITWWSRRTEPITVHNIPELDQTILDIERTCFSSFPTLVTIRVHGYELSFPVGTNESFVQLSKLGSLPPYLVKIGDPDASGSVVFLLDGIHDTEILRRYMIPSEQAKEIAREFYLTGNYPAEFGWDEV